MVRRFLAVCLAILIVAPSAGAQDHVIGISALEKAVQQRVSREQADREVILSLLQRQDVRDIAGKAGLSVDKARTAVSMLQGNDLQQTRPAGAGGSGRPRGRRQRHRLDHHNHHRPSSPHPGSRDRTVTGRFASALAIAAGIVTAAIPVSLRPRSRPPSKCTCWMRRRRYTSPAGNSPDARETGIATVAEVPSGDGQCGMRSDLSLCNHEDEEEKDDDDGRGRDSDVAAACNVVLNRSGALLGELLQVVSLQHRDTGPCRRTVQLAGDVPNLLALQERQNYFTVHLFPTDALLYRPFRAPACQ